MKKSKLIIVIAAILLVVGVIAGIAIFSGSDKDKSDGKNTNTNSSKHEHSKAACDYLTQDVADKVLGETGTQKGAATPDASSDDIKVTVCTYTTKAGNTLESIRNMRSATLLVRAPLTDAGADSNKTPFESRGPNTQKVDGLGEQAYWDPELAQLNVLKDHTWFILSVGKTNITERSLPEAKAFAETIGLSSNVY